jgi:hypothetical protein
MPGGDGARQINSTVPSDGFLVLQLSLPHYRTLPSDDANNFALLLFKRHILSSAQELFRRRGPGASPERRLHRIDHRIAEGEVIFLRSSGLIFPVGPTDAGDSMEDKKEGDSLSHR